MARPSRRGRGVAIHAAGMQPDRQIVLRRRLVDRPVIAPAQHHLARHRHQHLHETLVCRLAFDLLGREQRRLRRHHDRGTQPRFLVQPLLGDPVVHRRADRRAHRLADRDLPAIHRVADRHADAERIECLAAHRVQARARFALSPAASPPGRSSVRSAESSADRARRSHAQQTTPARTSSMYGSRVFTFGTDGWMSQSITALTFSIPSSRHS